MLVRVNEFPISVSNAKIAEGIVTLTIEMPIELFQAHIEQGREALVDWYLKQLGKTA